MVHCVEALVVKELVADLTQSTKSKDFSRHKKLGLMSEVLEIESDEVELCLRCPGTIELATLVSLAFHVVGSLDLDALPSDVRDVAQQTIAILSETAEPQLVQPIAQLNILDAKFNHIIVSSLCNLLQRCISGTSILTSNVRRTCLRMCLKSLCYCAEAFQQLDAFESLPSYFPRTLTVTVAGPEITHLFQTEQDHLSRLIGRCFDALAVKKLVANVRLSTDSNIPISDDGLVWLSASLGTLPDVIKLCLECPGAVELVNMVSFALGDVGPLDLRKLPSHVYDVVRQTLAILSQALPAETVAGPLVQPLEYDVVKEIPFPGVVSSLHNLLQMCISGTSPLTTEVRTSCLRMCLKSLWYCAKTYHQFGASCQLPSHFPKTLANPEIIRRIQAEQDTASRMMGRCFWALLVGKLAADVRPRSTWNPRISHNELAYLSTVFGTEEHVMEVCLHRSGPVELATIVSLGLGDVFSLDVDVLPSDVLDAARNPSYSF